MKKLLLVATALLVCASTKAAEAPKVLAPVVVSQAVVAPLPEVAPVVVNNAPPAWLDRALDIVSAMPVVGPVVVEVAKWLGVVASVLTILVTALMGLLKALQGVLKLAKLADLALKLEAFANGPVMYWLKFLSVYNAKKAEKKEDGKAA